VRSRSTCDPSVPVGPSPADVRLRKNAPTQPPPLPDPQDGSVEGHLHALRMRQAVSAPEPHRPWTQRIRARMDSLTARVMLASVGLALNVALVFLVLAITVSDLSDTASREARAKDVVTDLVVLQSLVVDLDGGARGFAITHDQTFLDRWTQAHERIPGALDDFVREAGDDPARRRAARRLSGTIHNYLEEYSEPLVSLARDMSQGAASAVAVQQNELRTKAIRIQLDSFLKQERERAAATADSAEQEANRAIALGFGGILASVVMILLLGIYLTRSIARPVQQVAVEANRIARGELTVDLDERGSGEIGMLKRAFLAMAADLAERRRALEEQNMRLRESERLKSELVSIVSHEIRTPLASILGFTSVLLQRDVSDADRRRFLEIIGAEARRLTALLDEFLDVQRLEGGPVDLAVSDVDVSALVRTQVALFSAESDKHWLELRLPDDPLVVEGDAGRLAQVFSNLISNAIKYSPEGGAVEVSGEQENGIVRIRVRDEGFGIPPEAHDRIFTKFYRGAAAARGIAGSGLGLALARTVVEAHGGSIDFESRAGEGTVFMVELPVGSSGFDAAEDGERSVNDA
jgi:signal transduction histidine kinase